MQTTQPGTEGGIHDSRSISSFVALLLMVHAVRGRAPRGVGVRSEDIHRAMPSIERSVIAPEDSVLADLVVEVHRALDDLRDAGPAAWRWRSSCQATARSFALDGVTTRLHARCVRGALKALCCPETPAEHALERALQCARFGRIEQARALFDEFIGALVPPDVVEVERVRRFVRAPVLSVAFRFGARSASAVDDDADLIRTWRGFQRERGLVTRTTESGTKQMVEERRRLEVGFGLVGVPTALVALKTSVTERFAHEYATWLLLLCEHLHEVHVGARSVRRDLEIAAETVDASRCPHYASTWRRVAADFPQLTDVACAALKCDHATHGALTEMLAGKSPGRHGEYLAFLLSSGNLGRGTP